MTAQKTGDTLGYGVVMDEGEGWYQVTGFGQEPMPRSAARELASSERHRNPDSRIRMVRIVLDK